MTNKLFLIIFSTLTIHNLTAQEIEHSIPEGYEQNITKEDYKFVVEQFYNQHPQRIFTGTTKACLPRSML